MSIGSGSLFSILLMWRIMDIAYCITMVLISSIVSLMLSLGISNVVSKFSIVGIHVDALVPTVITICVSTFHPLWIRLSINDLCFSKFQIIISSGIMSNNM